MKGYIKFLHSIIIWSKNTFGYNLFAAAVSKIFLPCQKGSMIINLIYGFKISVNPSRDKIIDHQLYYYGTYEPGTLKLLETFLRPGDIFMDVGANIGLMSLYAAKLVGDMGKVYSFEPVPEIQTELRNNIEINHFTNVTVFSTALGNETGNIDIFMRREISRGAATLLSQDSTSDVIRVAINTLDNFEPIRNVIPKVMKIDVEGWELNVLNGGIHFFERNSPKVLIVEFMTDNTDIRQLKAVFDFVKGCRYKFFKFEKGSYIVSRLVEVSCFEEAPINDNLICIDYDFYFKMSNNKVFKNNSSSLSAP